jgi:hypothetical protein
VWLQRIRAADVLTVEGLAFSSAKTSAKDLMTAN